MSYESDGYVLLKNAVSQDLLDDLDQKVVGLLREWTGIDVQSTSSKAFADILLSDRELERRLYDGVRNFDWLPGVSSDDQLKDAVSTVMGPEFGLFSKIPLRFDLPAVIRELAVWHQDYWYVKGNTDVVTLWMPLQDTPYDLGCLMVMPGSHKLGALNHDGEALGKRHYPKGVFDREVRYVEMKRGDVLMFHSLLLHSSGMNVAKTARLSIQARYTPLNAPADPGMGTVIPLSTKAED